VRPQARSQHSVAEGTQRLLAQSLGRRHAVLTGSGTAALAIACQRAPAGRDRVVIPAIGCAQVLFAVRYAGRTPVLADVRETDGTLDPDAAAALLRADPGIGAIIAVHTFGHPADMSALAKIARSHGVLLIEDLAQAHGGHFASGRPFGSAGDLAVLSFGHTKILDAGGGGALLFDEEAWLGPVVSADAELPQNNDPDRLRSLYSRLYYEIWAACRADPAFAILFDEFHVPFHDLFMRRGTEDQAERISTALPRLKQELEHRRSLFAVYEKALGNLPGVRLFSVDPRCAAPWRFSFRVPLGIRDGMLAAVREAGFHASAWYPCLAAWHAAARSSAGTTLPVADRMQDEIANLWLDGTTTEATALAASDVVRRVLFEKDYRG
jgi:dTDP-4-amino-4,6-dideoxygalactose transaminase